jgi:hypothetical protein
MLSLPLTCCCCPSYPVAASHALSLHVASCCCLSYAVCAAHVCFDLLTRLRRGLVSGCWSEQVGSAAERASAGGCIAAVWPRGACTGGSSATDSNCTQLQLHSTESAAEQCSRTMQQCTCPVYAGKKYQPCASTTHVYQPQHMAHTIT